MFQIGMDNRVSRKGPIIHSLMFIRNCMVFCKQAENRQGLSRPFYMIIAISQANLSTFINLWSIIKKTENS